ncbi:hypothetical protein ACFL04_03010 [Patescibacteria group bacterium]
MEKQYVPWQLVKEKDFAPFIKLVEAYLPAILLKPGDLWRDLRCLVRVAILKQPHRGREIDVVKIAVHLIWDKPTKKYLRKRYGRIWSKQKINEVYRSFVRHEKRWGIKDVECLTITLRRKPTGTDRRSLRPSQFVPVEIKFRNGAHFRGVLKQLFTWYKKPSDEVIGQHMVTVDLTDPSMKKAFRWIKTHIVLVIDSYHHSLYSPAELQEKKVQEKISSWKQVVIPKMRYFTNRLWRAYSMHRDGLFRRTQEDWERG